MNFNSVICLYNILILQKIEKYRFGKIGTQIGTDVTDPRFQARRDWSISKKIGRASCRERVSPRV